MLYISSNGRQVAGHEAAAASGIGVTLQGAALSRYLVVNLGWVALETTARGVRIVARPRVLSAETLVALFYALEDAQPQRIDAKLLLDTWESLSFSTCQVGMMFISELSTRTQLSHWLGRDRLIRHSVASTESQFGAILPRVMMIASNVQDPNIAVDMLGRVKSARWSICEIETTEMQSAVVAHNSQYLLARPSAAFREFCDLEYADWVSAFHIKTLDCMRPRFDQVDAIADFHAKGDLRMQYDLLTVPFQRPDGSRALICGAIDNVNVDLRKSVHQVA